MDYGVVKELKEAGFPGSDKWQDIGSAFQSSAPLTLSELIEACGDKFSSLSKAGDGWIVTFLSNITSPTLSPTTGKTPEEAVAKLWLALNKK